MKCKIDQCQRTHEALGYCHRHYERVRLTGNPHVVPSRDIDEMTVDLAVRGYPTGRLTIGEREEAVRRLHQAGATYQETANRVGLAGLSGVYAIKKRLGLVAGQDGRK